MLTEYISDNIEEWKQKFSIKTWFDQNNQYYHGKDICNLLARILIRDHSNGDLNIAINREFDDLFEIKSPIIKRIKPVIIQNLVIEEDQVYKFENQYLTIKGREERWHEGKVAKSCKIEDFSLNFQICLRRISPEEFDSISQSRGLLADRMNISTFLEIIYEFPNDIFGTLLSKESFMSSLATSKVSDLIDNIINMSLMAIKLITGQVVNPVVLNSIPENYYIRELSPKGYFIQHKNWMYSFFTRKCILSPKRLEIVQEVLDILYKNEKFPIAKQVFNIIERADIALQFELLLPSLTMYWIIMESILKVPFKVSKRVIAKQASWLYGSDKKDKEKKFWNLVYDIRNAYTHGDLLPSIDNQIKKTYKKKNIKWFVLVTREKVYRVLLFLLLLRESLNPSHFLFKDPKLFSDPPFLSIRNQKRFREWVQLSQENEIGRLENYRIKWGSRLISI